MTPYYEHEGVDQHFAYFRSVYDRTNQSWSVQKTKKAYEATKKSFGPLERLLNGIESRFAGATQHAATIYEGQFYSITKHLPKVCRELQESLKNTFRLRKTVAKTCSAVSLGLTVIVTQWTLLGLVALMTFTTVFLNFISRMLNLGLAAVARGVQLEKSVEQKVDLPAGESRELAEIPVDKINEDADEFSEEATD